MDKSEAARTAADALAEIAMWSRATAFAALAAAGLLLIMTIGAGFVLSEYIHAKAAVNESMAAASQAMREFEARRPTVALPERPGVPPLGVRARGR